MTAPVLDILVDEVVVRGFGMPHAGDVEALLLAEIRRAVAASGWPSLDRPIDIGTVRVVSADGGLDEAVRRAARAVAAAIAGRQRQP